MRANVGGLLQYVTKSLRLRAGAVRSPAYAAAVVAFEFRESVYELTDNQATFLAETLRNYAKGKCPSAIKEAADLGGNASWIDGALAVAGYFQALPSVLQEGESPATEQ